jgi:transposase
MSKKRTYFPATTAQQRKLLFETWETTGNVSISCQQAHVGRGTFYYWKSRFDEEGYAGLERYQRKGPKKGSVGTPANVRQEVREMRRKHPKWGKHRISDEMAKANNWVPLVSPNTVRSILEEAGLWNPDGSKKKKVLSNPWCVQRKSLNKPSM